MNAGDFPPNPHEKPGYTLEFNDDFDDQNINLNNWIPYYLPQWSSRKQSAPRYHFEDGNLILRIDEDQQPWCPEFDGDVKCSSIQTGVFSGPEGSQIGQHHFKANCVVREVQTPQRTYTPLYGYFEARIKAVQSASNLVALWMIGFEETPTESGEIAMFEVFGDQITPETSEVRYGIHPWGDPSLVEEFYRDVIPMDATQFHIYAIEWTPTHIDFFVDNVQRKTILQSPSYPMQFMLGIYEIPGKKPMNARYPKQFVIDYFRGYRPKQGYGQG